MTQKMTHFWPFWVNFDPFLGTPTFQIYLEIRPKVDQKWPKKVVKKWPFLGHFDPLTPCW